MSLHLIDHRQGYGCRIYTTTNPELRAAIESIRNLWQPHQDRIEQLEQAAANLPPLPDPPAADPDPVATFNAAVKAGIAAHGLDLSTLTQDLRHAIIAEHTPRITADADNRTRNALNSIGSAWLAELGREIESNIDLVLSHLNDRLQVTLAGYRRADAEQRDDLASTYQQLRDAQWACVAHYFTGDLDRGLTPAEWAAVGYIPDAVTLWESPEAYRNALLAPTPETMTKHGTVRTWPHPLPARRGNRPSDAEWLAWFASNPRRAAWIPTATEMKQARDDLDALKAAVRPAPRTVNLMEPRTITRRRTA